MPSGTIVSSGPLPEWVSAELAPRYQVVVLPEASAAKVLAALDSQVVALIARGPTFIDCAMMDAAHNLKVIARSGVGFDTVDIGAATQRKLPVVYTPGVLSRAVAEHTVALILAAAKNLLGWHEIVLRHPWEERYHHPNRDLEGATVGIIGFGRIGRDVWRLLRPFDVKGLAYDPLLDPARFPAQGVRLVSLDELLAQSDIVTLHAPFSEATRNLINRQTIEKFKAGAILVNTARGGLMESHDILVEALESGRLSAVALDVFVTEPPDRSHPLFQHPRALFTAHVGSNTASAQQRILRTMLEDMKAVLEGRQPRLENVVNPEVFKD